MELQKGQKCKLADLTVLHFYLTRIKSFSTIA